MKQQFVCSLGSGQAVLEYPDNLNPEDRASLLEWLNFVARVVEKRMNRPDEQTKMPKAISADACKYCQGTGIVRSLGRDTEEIINECEYCAGDATTVGMEAVK